MPKSSQNKVRPKSTKRSKKKQPKPRKGEKRSKAPRRGRKSRKIKKGKQGKKYRKMKGGADFGLLQAVTKKQRNAIARARAASEAYESEIANQLRQNIDIEIRNRLSPEAARFDRESNICQELYMFLINNPKEPKYIYFVGRYSHKDQKFIISVGINNSEVSIYIFDCLSADTQGFLIDQRKKGNVIKQGNKIAFTDLLDELNSTVEIEYDVHNDTYLDAVKIDGVEIAKKLSNSTTTTADYLLKKQIDYQIKKTDNFFIIRKYLIQNFNYNFVKEEKFIFQDYNSENIVLQINKSKCISALKTAILQNKI